MMHNQEMQINELQNQLSETISLDEKPQQPDKPDGVSKDENLPTKRRQRDRT